MPEPQLSDMILKFCSQDIRGVLLWFLKKNIAKKVKPDTEWFKN